MRQAAVLAGSLALLAAGQAGHAPPLGAEELVTDLSEHQIAIRSTFTGTEILLFGAVETDDPDQRALQRDVVVVVTGPRQDVVVRRKERLAGIWANSASVVFEDVPGYYAVASTRPVEVAASRDLLEIEEIGTRQLRFQATEATALEGGDVMAVETALGAFQDALVRLKETSTLYNEAPGGVVFLGQTLFRATIPIPANVPAGLYTATVFLLRDGVVISAQSSPLYIEKSGLERRIYRFAQEAPLAYGIFAVALALVAGWIASAIFRSH